MTSPKRVTVIGGTGAVGSAVVRVLAARGLLGGFTYLSREAEARALGEATGFEAHQLDLRDRSGVTAFAASAPLPDVLVVAAAITRDVDLSALDDATWDEALAVNATAAFVLGKGFGLRMAVRGEGELVFVGALDRGQTLPLPVHFAATQALLGGLVMALAGELGPRGVRSNLVVLGPLSAGMSSTLPPSAIADYEKYSALRRRGTPDEAARAIAWLALENTSMTGRTIAVNGGI